MRRLGGALVGAMLMAGTASAQTTDRGYVEGFAGLVRVNETTSGMFGGEVGFKVMDRLELFGNLGHAPQTFEGRAPCEPIICDVKERMTFFTGGAR